MKDKMKKKMMMQGKDMMTEKEMKKMMAGMMDDKGFYGHHTVKSMAKK